MAVCKIYGNITGCIFRICHRIRRFGYIKHIVGINIGTVRAAGIYVSCFRSFIDQDMSVTAFTFKAPAVYISKLTAPCYSDSTMISGIAGRIRSPAGVQMYCPGSGASFYIGKGQVVSVGKNSSPYFAGQA